MSDDRQNKYNRLAVISILLFIIETTIDGTGRLIDFGFVSIQMILFALACLLTLNPLLCNFKETMLNPNVIATVIFGIAVIVWTYVGFARGNESRYIRADVTSVMTFLLLPGFIATINDKRKLNTALKVFFIAASSAAVIEVLLYCMTPFLSETAIKGINTVLRRMAASIGSTRVEWRIASLYSVAMILGFYYMKNAGNKEKSLIYAAEACMLLSLIISLTRSKWLGFAGGCVILAVLEKKEFKRLIINGAVTLLFFGIIVGIASLCYGRIMVVPEMFGRVSKTITGTEESGKTANPNEIEYKYDGNDSEYEDLYADDLPEGVIDNKQAIMDALGSDNLRKIIVSRHYRLIKEYFFTGMGLGAKMGKQWEGKSEYMYLDFLQKMGVFGFASFIAAFFLPVILFFKNLYRQPGYDRDGPTAYIISGYLSLAVVSIFNPYLTNPMGIIILLMCASAVTIDGGLNDKPKQTAN